MALSSADGCARMCPNGGRAREPHREGRRSFPDHESALKPTEVDVEGSSSVSGRDSAEISRRNPRLLAPGRGPQALPAVASSIGSLSMAKPWHPRSERHRRYRYRVMCRDRRSVHSTSVEGCSRPPSTAPLQSAASGERADCTHTRTRNREPEAACRHRTARRRSSTIHRQPAHRSSRGFGACARSPLIPTGSRQVRFAWGERRALRPIGSLRLALGSFRLHWLRPSQHAATNRTARSTRRRSR